jgi:hypothetical protein
MNKSLKKTEKKPGYDESGNPVTVGGEIINRDTFGVGLVGRDQYVKERNILNSYNKILQTHEELKKMKGHKTKNDKKMDAIRGSLSENEMEMNVVKKLRRN